MTIILASENLNLRVRSEPPVLMLVPGGDRMRPLRLGVARSNTQCDNSCVKMVSDGGSPMTGVVADQRDSSVRVAGGPCIASHSVGAAVQN